jgi:hypothetical protein
MPAALARFEGLSIRKAPIQSIGAIVLLAAVRLLIMLPASSIIVAESFSYSLRRHPSGVLSLPDC